MEQNNYCVLLHEENSNERLTANQMQSVLSDIKYAFLTINGLKNATSVGVSMGTAIQGRHGKVAGHVEKCLCPTPYEDMSCQNCREGYTREVPNSNAFVDCVTCSCNNRSRECDGESGVCKGCRLSLGDHCEICGFGVDISTGCSQCLPTYWHPDIANEEKACRTCSCVLNNTIYHNSSICNATTGQCSCKSYVGGLQCERCAENYYNTSHGCRECPICYGMMKSFLHNLRELIIKVDKTAEHLERRFDAIKNNEFAVRLSNATLTVNEIFSKTNITNGVELTRLNVTSAMLNDLTSEVRIIQEQVEMFKTSKEKLSLSINMTISWVKDGYRSLENANTSRKRIIKIKDNITSYVYDLQKARDMMSDLVEIISALSKISPKCHN
ncbi:laminin subunit gamma-1-like [Xenia sp. Carnegie-2017]|uniref:laminin subunit gamma-1-like n=1 Tax=Xenia sp. Carnegie-2017 TaxID=2897299 RepID=UPI001F04B2AD|nr:laminin subunit gamma-1-like [Xenia sp. Carnegie-2017]